ncbi:hypothetical protein RRG08_042484 [Elysia crispata]|uniref:Uncharacterized protein n=1 Tax=Elysia crispata TaxID=231223 RepID=A0AAE0YDL0_9GAST|nr:hypothetical protein RRG08_042484 [Elysia crispata]
MKVLKKRATRNLKPVLGVEVSAGQSNGSSAKSVEHGVSRSRSRSSSRILCDPRHHKTESVYIKVLI